MLGRVDGDGVTGVDTRTFYVFHDSRDEDILAVVDGIDLDLSSLNVLIDKHGVLDTLRKDDLHVFLNVLIVECDDHVLTAQYIGRS